MNTECNRPKLGPREAVRALMRGNKATFKSGYTAENAVIASQEISYKAPDEAAYNRLLNYARGFGDGLKGEPRIKFAPQEYISGHIDGIRENADNSCQPG